MLQANRWRPCLFGTMIAVETAGLREPLKKSIETAAALQADAIEIDARAEVRPDEWTQTARRQFRKYLADARLCVAAVHFHTRRGYDVAEDLQRRVEATQKAMRLAAELGAPVLVNRVGVVPEDTQSRPWTTLVEVLTDLGRTGQKLGVRLAAQTGSESGPRLAALLAAIPPGGLAVALDPGALLLGGYSVDEALTALAPDLAHVYATDATRDLGGRGVDATLGTGGVDYPSLLATLAEYDYQGAISVGCRGASDPREVLGSGVKKLRQWLSRG